MPQLAYCGVAPALAPARACARARAPGGRARAPGGRPAPATTSLRLAVAGVGRARAELFAEAWLRSHVEHDGGLWGTPVSVEGGDLVYYGGDGGVRGVLRLAVSEAGGGASGVELRVESASRFLNRGGQSSASLPGERGVVRSLFRGVMAEFGEEAVELLYKPPHIRLGAAARARARHRPARGCGGAGDAGFGVVMVARVRGEATPRVAAWAERWSGRVFSGEARFFGSGGVACEIVGEGEVAVRCGRHGEEVVMIRVRRRAHGAAAFAEGVNSGAGAGVGTGVGDSGEGSWNWGPGGEVPGDEGVVVTAATNAPEGTVMRRVLRRLAGDLQGAFRDCRIHYPR